MEVGEEEVSTKGGKKSEELDYWMSTSRMARVDLEVLIQLRS